MQAHLYARHGVREYWSVVPDAKTVMVDGRALCRTCAGEGYYASIA